MSEPAVPETKTTYKPCTNAKILETVKAASILFDMKPLDVYTYEASSGDINLKANLVEEKWSLCYDIKLTDPHPFPTYVITAYILLLRKGLKPTFEDSARLACSTLIRKAPSGWNNLLSNGLTAYFDRGERQEALTILRFLAENGHHVEVILSRYNNTSPDYIWIVYITGLGGYSTAALCRTTTSFTTTVLAKAQDLAVYCNEPNFACRIDLSAKLYNFEIGKDELTLVRRSFPI